jgi:hypothetical protein
VKKGHSSCKSAKRGAQRLSKAASLDSQDKEWGLYRAFKMIKIVGMGKRKEGHKSGRVAVLIQGTEEYTGLWLHPATQNYIIFKPKGCLGCIKRHG